uniref:Putative radical SAM superfamily protein n=1 Tax=viral metagenome TaxID=1070528 RepID=A0A6M3XA97_9ZZZZ
MEIALVIPDSPFLLDPLGFPQLGPLYVSASLKKAGYNPKVYDLTGTSNSVPEIEADIIGITSSTPQFPYAVKIMKSLRGFNPTSIFIIGGPHAINAPETCRDAGFDITMAGEGELFSHVVSHIETRRLSTDTIIRPQPTENLDDIPYPDREAIDIDRYHFYVTGEKTLHLMTQRGCPYGCAFCSGREVKSYRWVRHFSDDYVIREINHLRDTYGVNAFMFFDDEFNINKKRTLRLCERFKGMGIAWRCQIRSNLFDAELAQAMSESGCKEVGCGVETGSMIIKKNIHKKTTPEQDLRAVELAHEYGMKFKCFIIVGLPGETRETFDETRAWVKKAQPDNFDYTVLMPYPGSPIWEYPERYDIEFDKQAIIDSNFDETWYKGTTGGPPKSLVRTSALSHEDIMQLRLELEEEFPRSPSTAWAGTALPENGG